MCSPTYYKPPNAKASISSNAKASNSSNAPPTRPHRDLDYVCAADVDGERFAECVRRLRRTIPTAFWDVFHGNITWYGNIHKESIKQAVDIALASDPQIGWSRGCSAMKWLSYHGAVKMRELNPRDLCWIDPVTKVGYFDAMNRTYCHVFGFLWPGCFARCGVSNVEAKGDCMEAFLGYGYLLGSKQTRYQKQILDDLDDAIFYVHKGMHYGS